MSFLDSKNDQEGFYQVSEAGTIASLAASLVAEYALSGYSLFNTEVETALINDVLFYAGFQSTVKQKRNFPAVLDNSYMLYVNEWAVIKPLIQAHCEVLQAKRMESTASLGTERFGLSVSEAEQGYTLAMENLPKNAFVSKPVVI